MIPRLPISGAFTRLVAAVLLGNGLTAILGIVALRLYTELAPPEIYGMANLVLGSLALASQCVVQPVTATQIRYHTEAADQGRGDDFTAEALFVVFCGTVVLGLAAAVVLALFLWGAVSHVLATSASVAIWSVLSGGRAVYMGRLHAGQQMRVYMLLRVCESALTIAATCLLLYALSPHPAAFVVGQCAGFLCITIYLAAESPLPLKRMLALRRLEADFRSKLVAYGAPFVPLAVLYWLASLADRYVLAAIMGPAAAGRYFAAFIIAAAGFGIMNAVMGDLFRPKLFEAENASDRERAHRIFLAWLACYTAVSVCILAGIALLGDWLIWLVISPAYRDGALILLVWIGLGFCISGLTTALENRLLSFGRSNRLILPVAVGAASNVVMSYVLIRANGTLGAAQACCLSFAAQLVCTLLVVRRAAAERGGALAANPV